ncbi:hypothetical protein [Luteimonas sp. MC1750]|uniref:hypothetical protein n=1 Tax=Luteimonas sp. MC1750 TaxID=2799326 RepID=UPI0018F0CD75|nr:hypothetical protein [Luteimonas sp. MC1750]MBJ6983971.1 hypothetical protein [Luteimonas sp. MC1750]QQO06784.1 hypothetical protein JGR68_04995 [Luteimonas sp. MC1750]
MPDLEAINAQLDELAAQLPQMIEDNPDHGDFWATFAGEADVIEDQAGEHCQHVMHRINAMLAEHGRYVAGVDFEEA